MGLFGKRKEDKAEALTEAQLEARYPRNDYGWQWFDVPYRPDPKKSFTIPGRELVIEDKYGNIVYRNTTPTNNKAS